jgi:hypothetical protein
VAPVVFSAAKDLPPVGIVKGALLTSSCVVVGLARRV